MRKISPSNLRTHVERLSFQNGKYFLHYSKSLTKPTKFVEFKSSKSDYTVIGITAAALPGPPQPRFPPRNFRVRLELGSSQLSVSLEY